MMLFEDRRDAGSKLAKGLEEQDLIDFDIVLGLPRGGVPVAYQVARHFRKPLDIFVVRKLGFPGQEEFAMGAIGPDRKPVLNTSLIRQTGLSDQDIELVVVRELKELDRRTAAYRKDLADLNLTTKKILLVDDGLATGSTMLAACQSARQMDPQTIVACAPVGSKKACRELESVADRVFCLEMPEAFFGVGQWYEIFEQTSDSEVLQLLKAANQLDPFSYAS